MSTKKVLKSKYASVNVDPSFLENLNGTILATNDVEKLYEFLSNEFNKQQLITIWSYYSTINDHPHFTSTTITLIKLFRSSNNDELQPLVVPLIKELLNNHTKILFRGLSNMKPSITNPILNMLTEIAKFKNGVVLDDLLTNFDLHLAIIPKLLSPSVYRSNFIEFWLAILSNAPYLQRQDLLINYKKLNNTLYKFLSEDSVQISKKILSTLDLTVLSETHYNRQLKCKIFNEYNLSKLVSLFTDTTDSSLKDQAYEFLIKLTTSEKFGLSFADDKIWFHNTNGVTVQHSTFKIYNKLILSLLENLKPYDDDSHLNLVIEIVTKIPELIPPYTQYLFQIHGANDPRLSSFWIGQTLLLQKLICLPIPAKLQDLVLTNENELSTDLIIENLLPSPLTKACLVKSLQSESLLIRQITCQTLLFFFQKLKSVMSFLHANHRDDSAIKLTDLLVKIRLPELTVLVSILNESFVKNPEKKLLILSLTMIVKEYLLNFPSLTATIPNDVYANLIKGELSGVELVTLDNYLELQENISDSNSIVAKWWNASNDQNSFFTNLLKLSISNPTLSIKVSKILNKLVDQTIIFSKDLLVSQIYLILLSLKYEFSNTEDQLRLWKFFDEIISRCVRSPYKYLDKARELTNEPLSPLVVTIFEQWNFVEKNDSLNEWFSILMRYLILIGESSTAIKKLFLDNKLSMSKILDFQNYETNFVNDKSVDKKFFLDAKDDSFFDFVLVTPLSSVSDKRIPINRADLVGLIRRLEFIIADDYVILEKVENVIISLMEMVGNYLTASSMDFEEKYWKRLFIGEENDNNAKLMFVSRILNEIFKQLELKSDHFNKTVESFLKANQFDVVTSECCWCLSDEQLISFIDSESEIVRLGILREVIERKLKISHCHWSTTSAEEFYLINEVVRSELVSVENDVVTKLIASNDKNSYHLIQSLCQVTDVEINTIKDKNLLVVVGSVINSETNKELLLNLVDETFDNFANNFDLEYIELISNIARFLPKERLLEIVSKFLTSDVITRQAKYLFSTELMKLLLTLGEYGTGDFWTDNLMPWFLKCLLYINQTFAQSPEISSSFQKFLTLFAKFFNKLNLWKFGAAHLNTQLEIVLASKFVTDVEILKYIYVLVQNANFKIEYNKSLQIFLNNNNNVMYHQNDHEARFYSAMIIHDLFYKDTNSNSSQNLQFVILQFYQGTKRTDDLILKKILTDIESLISFNLVNQFTSWEFIETFDEPFIKKEKDGLVITINKNLLNKSIKNHKWDDVSLPENLIEFYESNKGFTKDASYDDEFMMMLVINNDEIFSFQDEDCKIETKKLIESGLLQFIVLNLSHTRSIISQTAFKILASVFKSLEEGRTKNIFKVYLGNVLSMEDPSMLVISIYANLIPILNDPNHTLYDKLTKYLVSSSRLKNDEIPLFKYISQPSSNDLDSYYRQVSWFLESLSHGLVNAKDLKILNKHNIVEWLMNMYNNNYLNVGLKNLILTIILQIIKIGGLSWLIKSYSMLSWLESLSLEQTELTNDLVNRQFQLNFAKLSVAVKLMCDNVDGEDDVSNKRKLHDWFDHDLEHHVKRICH